MALRQIRVGSCDNIHQYDDADFDSAVETDQPIKAGTPVDPNDVLRLSDVPDFSTGVTSTFTHISSLQAGGAGAIGFQVKTQTITITSGIITNIGAESAWTDI